jgi:hypothetical protein
MKAKNIIISNEKIIENNQEIIPGYNHTIHKLNSLIRTNYKNKFSVYSLKLINNLYYQIQKRVGKENSKGEKYDEVNQYTLEFTLETLSKWMGVEKDKKKYKIVRETLEELRQDIKLENFKDSEGVKWKYLTLSFVNRIGEKYGTEKHKQEKVFIIKIDEYLHREITKVNALGNWTKLDLSFQRNWSNFNTIKLYEFLKSYQKLKIIPELDLIQLNELLGTNYQYLSKISEIIKRNIIIINEDSDLDIKWFVNKKEKIIKFEVNKKEKYKRKEEKQKRQLESYKEQIKNKGFNKKDEEYLFKLFKELDEDLNN